MDVLKTLPFREFPLKRSIGCGSTATVYATDENIALKAFRMDKILETPGKDAKIVREMQHNARMTGSEFFPTWEGGYRDHTHVFLAQRLIRGTTLRDLHVDTRRLDERFAMRTLAPDMSRFIADCHARGIAHRDVHMGNFVFDPSEERTYGIDLGIASNDVSAFPSDIWSLGMSWYRLLYGRHPVYRDGERMIHAVMDSSVSLSTNDLLAAMLHHDPARRPTIDEVRRAL